MTAFSALPPEPASPLSGPQKTALLLLLLSDEQAAGLLRRLDPDEVEAVGAAMLSVAEAAPETIERLLDELLETADRTVPVPGGPEGTRAMLGRALRPDRAEAVLDRLGEAARPRPFASLDWAEPEAVAAILADEHPQMIAALLVHLAPARAAAVLKALAAERQADIVRRVATIGPVDPATLAALEALLDSRLRAAARPPQPARGGIDRAASLINLAGLDAAPLVAAIGADAPDQAAALSEGLFTFSELAKLDDRALQTLMRGLEADTLVPALKGADPALRERLLGTMSARAADALRDEIANRGPIRIDEAIAAQKAMAAAARRLAEEGTIQLPGKGPAYV